MVSLMIRCGRVTKSASVSGSGMIARSTALTNRATKPAITYAATSATTSARVSSGQFGGRPSVIEGESIVPASRLDRDRHVHPASFPNDADLRGLADVSVLDQTLQL